MPNPTLPPTLQQNHYSTTAPHTVDGKWWLDDTCPSHTKGVLVLIHRGGDGVNRGVLKLVTSTVTMEGGHWQQYVLSPGRYFVIYHTGYMKAFPVFPPGCGVMFAKDLQGRDLLYWDNQLTPPENWTVRYDSGPGNFVVAGGTRTDSQGHIIDPTSGSQSRRAYLDPTGQSLWWDDTSVRTQADPLRPTSRDGMGLGRLAFQLSRLTATEVPRLWDSMDETWKQAALRLTNYPNYSYPLNQYHKWDKIEPMVQTALIAALTRDPSLHPWAVHPIVIQLRRVGDTTLRKWDLYKDVGDIQGQIATITNIINNLYQTINNIQGCIDCNPGTNTDVTIPPEGGWRNDLDYFCWLGGIYYQRDCERLLYVSTNSDFHPFCKIGQWNRPSSVTMRLHGEAVVIGNKYYVNGSKTPVKRFSIHS